MRFGNECEEKKPINPMALAIISQISNKSMILITNRDYNRINLCLLVNGQYNNRIDVLDFLRKTMESETEIIEQK